MADGFTMSVDDAQVVAMLGRLAQSAEFVVRGAARDTAKRIVAEARARVRRATGETASEIHWELTRDEKGYVVLGYDTRINNTFVDWYQEYGTQYMRASSFFFNSAHLEEGPHLRRLIQAMQEWLDNVGR